MNITRFEKFLINRGLLEAFKHNFQTLSTKDNYYSYLSLYGSHEMVIFYAFTWSHTVEGTKFWSRLEDEWEQICNNQNLI